MKVVFICQTVDRHDPILAVTVSWIKALASQPQVESVGVIALRKGTYSPPDNVTVHVIKARSRLVTLVRFYQKVLSADLRKTDCFFIHQGGPYPVLLLPLKLLMGKPIYQWKTHPHISPMMRFCARFCDAKVFTATKKSFPADLPNVKVVGHGIDTDEFCIRRKHKTDDLVTVGRIAPVKRLDVAIKALARCNRRYGTFYRLNVYGPTLEKDREYREYLDALVKELELSEMVFFRGAVLQHELPNILNRCSLFLHFSRTALDKAVAEAMACGLPIISSNLIVKEILPEELRALLIVPEEDIDKQAEQIHHVLSLDEGRLLDIGETLRTLVVRDHSLTALFDKILAEMSSTNDRCPVS